MTFRVLRPLMIVLAALLLVPAGADAKGKVPRTYKAKIHVAGGVTMTTTYDHLANCAPGQSYRLVETADVEINGMVTVRNVTKKLTSSTTAVTPGGAVNANRLDGYQETNYCDDPVEIDKPDCTTNTGKGTATLNPDYRQRKPYRVAIAIGRRGGGDQPYSCLGRQVTNPTPVGTDIDALTTPISTLRLPLNLKVSEFRGLRKGKKLIRFIEIGGPSCKEAVVAAGKDPVSAPVGFASTVTIADPCEIEGRFNVEIKRLK